MSLQATIDQAKIAAMKEKNQEALSTLRMLSSAIKNAEIEKQSALTDEEVQAVIARQVKQLRDANTDFQSSGRTDLVEKTNAEIALLETYLPAQMSDEELQAIVKATAEEMGVTAKADMGKLMGAVMKKVAGQADGNRVKEMVTAVLQ